MVVRGSFILEMNKLECLIVFVSRSEHGVVNYASLFLPRHGWAWQREGGGLILFPTLYRPRRFPALSTWFINLDDDFVGLSEVDCLESSRWQNCLWSQDQASFHRAMGGGLGGVGRGEVYSDGIVSQGRLRRKKSDGFTSERERSAEESRDDIVLPCHGPPPR